MFVKTACLLKKVTLTNLKQLESSIYLTYMTCQSSDLIYVVICSSCNEECIGETGECATKLRDRVRVYRQHIRQPNYQQQKCEEHFRT